MGPAGIDQTPVQDPSEVATIIIAAYCAEATILRALRSATAQTVPVEIIVIDDCSTDRTYDIALEYSRTDPKVQVYRQEQNTGPGGARNLGIAKSSAPWIAVLDSDDYMSENRIEQLVMHAEAGGVDFLADDIYKVRDSDLSATDDRLWAQSDFGFFDLSFSEFVVGNRRTQNGQRGELGFVKPLMRRQFLERAGLAYATELRLAEDYLLYAKALAAGARFRMVDPCGYFAVYRSDSLSSQHSTQDLAAIVQADLDLARHPDLTQSDKAALKDHRLDVQKEWAWRRLIDAVHDRDLAAMRSLILQPPSVVLSLMGKLIEQAWLRGLARLRGDPKGGVRRS